MRILYLEDNPIDIEFTRRAIARADSKIELSVAGTVAEATAILDEIEAALARGGEIKYDLLLLDMHLPDGSGMSVLSDVRLRSLPLAVVVLTGSSDEETALTALRAGADDYLVKRSDYWVRLVATLETAFRNFGSKALFRKRPLRLLYVEPSESDIEFTRLHLAAHAPYIHFESAASGAAALTRLSIPEPEPDIDILLLDFRLQGMDAFELLKEFNQTRKLDLPIVIVTGHGSEEIAIQAVKLGVMDYLVKSTGYLYRLPMALESAYYRKLAERERTALRASESYLRAIIETEPECVKIISADGVLLRVNPAGLRMLEADSLPEAQQQSFLDFVLPEHREAMLALHKSVMAGESGSLIFEITGLKGGRRWLDTHATPMRDESGKVEVLLGITRDITERKRQEEQLRQSEKMTAIGQLAGGVAHDFNNQLSIMLGYAELLKNRLGEPELKRFASAIITAAKRSGDLTRNLLDFSRQGHLETVNIDFHDLIAEMTVLLGRSVDKRIILKERLRAKNAIISGDPAKIQNAMLNLALNARDAMPDGGSLCFATENLEIKDPLFDLPPGRYLHASITDTGSGMSKEVMRHIFEPFFTTKPVGKGTGMGLASVFGTMKTHHGMVTVESEPGQGTVFHLYLPVSSMPNNSTVTEAAIAPPPRGLRILLVDDDAQVREMVTDMLKIDNHLVLKADGGREALELYKIRWREIDLVLLDMVMPEMDGYQTFLEMRKVNPSAKVLLSSGFSPDGKIQSLIDEGVRGFLQKPYEKSRLDALIAQALVEA